MEKIKFWNSVILHLLFFVIICSAGCGAPPEPRGPAGMQLMYMVPGDKITLDNGKTLYVDQWGMLRGSEFSLQAAGRKVRKVDKTLSLMKS